MCPISLTGGVSVIGWVNKGSFRKIEDGKKNFNESTPDVHNESAPTSDSTYSYRNTLFTLLLSK